MPVEIAGTQKSSQRKFLEFQVLKCSMDSELRDDSDLDCAEPSLIEDFISDIEIETWSIHQQIDFIGIQNG
jgi:hypothetical protein